MSSLQIRGARAMLGWSLVDLAKSAHVSVSTVHRVENGRGSLDAIYAQARICDALETAGITFLSDEGTGPGVRLRP